MAQSVGESVVESISRPYRRLYDTVTKYAGDPSKLVEKKQDKGKLPDAWEEANRRSVRQALKRSSKKRAPRRK